MAKYQFMIVSDTKRDGFLPHKHDILSNDEVYARATQFKAEMDSRRSVREFSDKAIPKEVILEILETANNAPSGANKQPWTFCVISNKDLKRQIRERAEEEEYISYKSRMSEEWLKDIEPFGTNHIKGFIDDAPYIIVVFKKVYDCDENNNRKSNYYVSESVGIAVGFLLTAVHKAGLVSLTHTPSPMNFLQEVLERPTNERPYLLIPIGYPAESAQVPIIKKKPLKEVSVFYD